MTCHGLALPSAGQSAPRPPSVALRSPSAVINARLVELRARVRAACASGSASSSYPYPLHPSNGRFPAAEAGAPLLPRPAAAHLAAANARRCRFAPPPHYSSSTPSSSFLTPPLLHADVDPELWAALDVCLDDELEAVDDILRGGGPRANVKSALAGGGTTHARPASVARDGRAQVMHRVEARLRFLAADARRTLRGEHPSYRELLLDLRDALGVDCPRHLSTPDLEAELLAHALEKEVGDAVEEHGRASSPRREGGPRAAVRGWADRMAARCGGEGGSSAAGGTANGLAAALAKLGGALTVSAAGRSAARALAQQYVAHHVRAQALAHAVGGAAAASAAQRAVVVAAARFSALRGALALLGPAMWGLLAVDLALRALGADHARVARAVFVLAQVRLVRTGGFAPPPVPPMPSSPSSSSSAAFSERLYGPLQADGMRRSPSSEVALAEFRSLDDGGGSSGASLSSFSDDEDEGGSGGGSSPQDDDEDDLWLYGIA